MEQKEKMNLVDYTDIYGKICENTDLISAELFDEFGVKRGLRDKNGNGVLSGLTHISKIQAFKEVNGEKIPCDGKLWYRGYSIIDLVKGFHGERFGYEEVTYLLLFGRLPNMAELEEFKRVLNASRTLPTNFTRDVIMKAPSKDIMNSITKSVLTLASYDDNMADPSISNVLRQCLQLIAILPMLSVYGYHAYNHYECGESFYIHRPDENLSTAENILLMLRPDKVYTELEAKVLDIALVLHMEHGGANIKVVEMMRDLRENVSDLHDEEAIKEYLSKLLDKQAFDKKGLIYGMGHAVYSLSDPRARIFKSFVERLAKAKGRDEEFGIYSAVERLAPEVIAEKRKIYKGVSANVDFYSGFVYNMLDIPLELYTPIFAMARIVGWSAHRIEELVNVDKIIRPAYLSIMEEKDYKPLEDRE